MPSRIGTTVGRATAGFSTKWESGTAFLQGKLLSTASMISWERVPRLHEIMVAGEDLARAGNVILAVSDRRVVSGA
jgi:hypothetical protein